MSAIARHRTAAILLRLSHEKDAAGAEDDAIDRQEQACRSYAAAHDLDVVAVYDEGVGVSAYKRGTDRPVWEEATAALVAGEFDVLLVHRVDRLSRRGAGQVGSLLDKLEGTGRALVDVAKGLDSSTDAGRMPLIIFSELARGESANASDRIRLQKQQARDAGRWTGGANSVPYGFRLTEDKKLAVDPETGPVLLDVIEKVLDGRSIRSVANELNEAGVPTRNRNAKGWRLSTLANLLRSPVLCGWTPAYAVTVDDNGKERRSRTPEVYLGADGQPVEVGEALISPARWRDLQREIRSRTTSVNGKRRSAGRTPRSLLAGGMLRCGECGSKMAVDSSRRSYVCSARFTGQRCPGNSVSQQGTDSFVVWEFTARLTQALESGEDEEFLNLVGRRWVSASDPATDAERERMTEEADGLRARLDALDASYWTRGDFGDPTTEDARSRWLAVKAPIEERLAAVTTDLAAIPPTEPDLGVLADSETLAEAWLAADLGFRRMLLGLAIDRVVARKAKAERGVFDPARLSITWAGQEDR